MLTNNTTYNQQSKFIMNTYAIYNGKNKVTNVTTSSIKDIIPTGMRFVELADAENLASLSGVARMSQLKNDKIGLKMRNRLKYLQPAGANA